MNAKAINSPYSIAMAVYFHGTVKLNWHGSSLQEFHVPFGFTHRVQRTFLDFVTGYLKSALRSHQNVAIVASLSVPSPLVTTSLKIKSKHQQMNAIAITVAGSDSGSTKDSDTLDSNWAVAHSSPPAYRTCSGIFRAYH